MLIRQTLLYLPAQILGPGLALITILVWAHLLPTADVGIATLVVALQEISYTIFYLWWSHFALRHLPRHRANGVEEFLQTEAPSILIAALAQAAAFVPLSLLYFGPIGTPLLVSIVIYTVTRSLLRYFAERARSDGEIGLYTLIQVGGPAIGLLLNYALIPLYGASATVALAGFSIGQGLVVLVGIVRSDFGRARFRIRKSMLKAAAAFGAPIALANGQAMIALNAPRFIVDHMLGLVAAGQFAVSYGLGMRASSFAVMLVTAGAFPLVVRRMEREGQAAAYAQMRYNILLVAAVVMPVAFGLFAVNGSLVETVLPAKFHALAYVVLPLATIGGMLRSIRTESTDQIFLIRSRTVYSSLIGFCDLVLAVGLGYVGTIAFGATGAVIGPLAAAVATLTASQITARVVFDFPFPLLDVLRVAAAAGIMAAIVMLFPHTRSPLMLAGIVAVGAIVYPVALAIFLPGEIRGQGADMLRRLLGRLRGRRRVET